MFNVLEQIAFNRVNDLEIVQFTGLKDSTGKEVYEMDIIKNDDGDPHLITQEMSFNCSCCNQVYGWDFGDYGMDMDEKIIGNKFENPELLK